MLAKTTAFCLATNNTVVNHPPSLYSSSAPPTTPNSNRGGACPQIEESYEVQDIQLHLACPHLVRSAEICIGDAEVQANLIRTLSVLSEHQSCCDVLSDQSARLGMLLGPHQVERRPSAKPNGLIIRIGYILGNIMARYDLARSQVWTPFFVG